MSETIEERYGVIETTFEVWEETGHLPVRVRTQIKALLDDLMAEREKLKERIGVLEEQNEILGEQLDSAVEALDSQMAIRTAGSADINIKED